MLATLAHQLNSKHHQLFSPSCSIPITLELLSLYSYSSTMNTLENRPIAFGPESTDHTSTPSTHSALTIPAPSANHKKDCASFHLDAPMNNGYTQTHSHMHGESTKQAA